MCNIKLLISSLTTRNLKIWKLLKLVTLHGLDYFKINRDI